MLLKNKRLIRILTITYGPREEWRFRPAQEGRRPGKKSSRGAAPSRGAAGNPGNMPGFAPLIGEANAFAGGPGPGRSK